jgi:hypothetical protein
MHAGRGRRRRLAKARRAEAKFEQNHPGVVMHTERAFRSLKAAIANHAKMISILMQGAK